MAAGAVIDFPGLLTATALQNTTNINGTGTAGGTAMVDLQPYMGTCFVVIANSAGAATTAIQPKIYTSGNSSAADYNNYSNATNFATATNIGTSAAVQIVNVDLRAIAANTNRYLGIQFVTTGATANASIDATFFGQKKNSA